MADAVFCRVELGTGNYFTTTPTIDFKLDSGSYTTMTNTVYYADHAAAKLSFGTTLSSGSHNFAINLDPSQIGGTLYDGQLGVASIITDSNDYTRPDPGGGILDIWVNSDGSVWGSGTFSAP